jgi:hypothetical protein
MTEINWDPSARQLRQFGGAALIALPLAGWAVNGFADPANLSFAALLSISCLATVGAGLATLGLIAPGAIKPMFVGAMLIGWPVGLVIGEVMLVVVYYGLFTPTAFLFRIIGRDALQRKPDRSLHTYWTPKRSATNAECYFRQT